MSKITVDVHRRVKARKLGQFIFDALPGDCHEEGDGLLHFACPGCGRWGGVQAGVVKSQATPSWKIVKGELSDPEHLTLMPSINCVGCCGWHGYLVDGVFQMEAPQLSGGQS